MCRCVPLIAALISLAGLTSSAGATSFLHKKLADWRRDLEKASKPAVRRSAAFALGRIGAMATFALDDLARAVRTDRDDSVRDMAACAIGDIVSSITAYVPRHEWEKVGETLEEALARDASPRVRRSAAYAIGTFGDLAAKALPALKGALRDKLPSVRQNAAWALGRVTGDGSAVSDLCDRLADESVLVRRDAAAALGRLGGQLGRKKLRPAVKPLLALATGERDDVVLKTALSTLATLADESHRDVARELFPLLDHKDREIARSAAFALGNMGGDPARKALPALRVALNDADIHLQALAAVVLANAGGDVAEATDDLARMLTLSKVPEVRRNCAIALSRISKDVRRQGGDGVRMQAVARGAMDALVEALKAPPRPISNPARARTVQEVREAAAEAIANIEYPHNQKAIPALRDIIAKDPNHNFRQRCVWGLFYCDDLERFDLTRVLTKVLDETTDASLMVRYDIARVLAIRQTDRASDKVVETLLHMLNNRTLRVFEGTGAKIEGLPDEGRAGGSRATATQGGDARYMAVRALGQLGTKATKNKEVMESLRSAAKEADPVLRKEAEKAIEQLGRKN